MILNISSSQFTGQLTKGVVERVEDVGEVGWATIIPNTHRSIVDVNGINGVCKNAASLKKTVLQFMQSGILIEVGSNQNHRCKTGTTTTTG